MKKLILVLTVASLWACGPQQSSTERDQQQIQAEYLRIKAFYQPFAGSFVGTATIMGNTKEISLYLEPSDQVNPDVTKISEVGVPSLKGQLLQCLVDSCFFAKNPSDESNSNKISIASAVYDASNASHMTVYSSGGSATGAGLSCTAGTDCTPYIFDLYLNGKTITGTIKVGSNPVGPLTVTRL